MHARDGTAHVSCPGALSVSRTTVGANQSIAVGSASYAGGDGADGEHAPTNAVLLTPQQPLCSHIRRTDHFDMQVSAELLQVTPKLTLRHHTILRHAMVAGVVYQGMFGNWTVEPADELEVFIYRAGISVAAAGPLPAAHVGLSVAALWNL